jgi:hypothetical protein
MIDWAYFPLKQVDIQVGVLVPEFRNLCNVCMIYALEGVNIRLELTI